MFNSLLVINGFSNHVVPYRWPVNHLTYFKQMKRLEFHKVHQYGCSGQFISLRPGDTSIHLQSMLSFVHVLIWWPLLNSLSPSRCGSNFKSKIFCLMFQIQFPNQATSHHLEQCWSWYMSLYSVTRPQWVKPMLANYHIYNWIPRRKQLNLNRNTKFSFKKMHLKMLYAKCLQFCSGLQW